jgi:hypothetical protein
MKGQLTTPACVVNGSVVWHCSASGMVGDVDTATIEAHFSFSTSSVTFSISYCAGVYSTVTRAQDVNGYFPGGIV